MILFGPTFVELNIFEKELLYSGLFQLLLNKLSNLDHSNFKDLAPPADLCGVWVCLLIRCGIMGRVEWCRRFRRIEGKRKGLGSGRANQMTIRSKFWLPGCVNTKNLQSTYIFNRCKKITKTEFYECHLTHTIDRQAKLVLASSIFD